mgnify:CR=1 FL=1
MGGVGRKQAGRRPDDIPVAPVGRDGFHIGIDRLLPAPAPNIDVRRHVDIVGAARLQLAPPALRRVRGADSGFFPLAAAPTLAPERRLTVDELLSSRIKLPPGVGPLSLEDMERAIAEGSLGR